jgi:hypothetical protein
MVRIFVLPSHSFCSHELKHYCLFDFFLFVYYPFVMPSKEVLNFLIADIVGVQDFMGAP